MLLALSNNFFDNFPIFKYIKKENQLDINKKKLAEEVVAKKVFLKKDFEFDFNFKFDFNSDSKNINYFKINQLENNNLLFSKYFKAFIYLNSFISIFNTNYIREKLIKILSSDILILK